MTQLDIYNPQKEEPTMYLRLVDHHIYTDRVYLAMVDEEGKTVINILAIFKDGRGIYRTPFLKGKECGILSTERRSSSFAFTDDRVIRLLEH